MANIIINIGHYKITVIIECNMINLFTLLDTKQLFEQALWDQWLNKDTYFNRITTYS